MAEIVWITFGFDEEYLLQARKNDVGGGGVGPGRLLKTSQQKSTKLPSCYLPLSFKATSSGKW